MKPIIRTTALALTVLGLAVAPAAQAAKPLKVSKAKFAVTVDGVQNSTWSTDHKPDGIGGCDAAYTAKGSEKVRFTSSPLSVSAISMPGLNAPVLSRGRSGPPRFRLRGNVTRNGSVSAAPVDNGCGGPTGPAAAKDCGTKKFSGLATKLDYALGYKGRDLLDVRPENANDPFRNCGGGGTHFPALATKNMGRPMNLRLPRRELLNRKLGKIILIGRAREAQTSGEHQYTTTTKWVITLVRK